jgi:pyruvate dehydrogenase E2 component (dihydrolipoamide acetyltransferase)
MTIPITIPRLGWNMEQGVFQGWLQPDGALVRPGQPLFRLESDKATEDVESVDAGTLRIASDGPRDGDTIAVGTVIGHLVEAGQEHIETAKVEEMAPAAPARARISPRARRVAREQGIDWSRIQGSGRTGRIRERDVRAAAPRTATGSIRRTIAERMVASHRETAPVTLTATADATNLVNLRDQFKAAVQAGGEVLPSYTDFLVKLAACALQKHPLLNARWSGDQVIMSEGIHIGIAVDTDAGLLVPVLRDVPSLTLKQLAARSRDLIERARQGQLAATEMRGGTFTVTNLGGFEIETFTPLINQPECAILGVGRIGRHPVVRGDRIEVRDQVSLSLTFDHRIVDGGPAARFVQTLLGLIENPGPWLLA